MYNYFRKFHSKYSFILVLHLMTLPLAKLVQIPANYEVPVKRKGLK